MKFIVDLLRLGQIRVKEYLLNGLQIVSLETFFDEVGRVLIPGATWGRNLDAFNDILRGGFGTPRDGFTLRWSGAAKSKEHLGSAFDTLVEIIRRHGPRGDEAQDNVLFVLD